MHQKGGGADILLNDYLQCKKIYHGNFARFKYVGPQMNSSAQAMFLNIHSPPDD